MRSSQQASRLAPGPFVCFEISAASLAVVDPQARLSLDGDDRELVIIFTLTERTARSPVPPE